MIFTGKFDTALIYEKNDNDRYPNVILWTNLSSRSNSFILCHTTLSNVYVNGVERADMCEISLIFELGWQWWYKRGTCTTRIVPCTGWQISPSRHPCPAVSPCKYIRGWSSHWRRYFCKILIIYYNFYDITVFQTPDIFWTNFIKFFCA